jgi:purine-cytosine permease-like protein
MIQSRPQFGYMGALLVWGVALISYIGYNAFNDVLAAQAVHQLARSHAPGESVTIITFSVVAVSVAAIGYDWIHRAQRYLAYLLIAILSAVTIGAVLVIRLPAGQFDLQGFRGVPFLAQFFAAAAYQLSWSIYVSDYSRYLPHDVGVRASFWWTYVGAFIGATWTMLIGTFAAALHPHVDVAAAMQTAADAVIPGLGTLLLIGALLGLVTISALNFYGASLTLLSVADSFRPIVCTVAKRLSSLLAAAVTATVIALLASSDFVNRFADLLAVLLYLFTPWTAINLVDFYLIRKGHYSVREIFNPHGMYGRWNWRGLLAYGIGFAVMIPFFSTGLYTGPVARALKGADLAMLVGLPVATLVYILACRSMDVKADRQRAAIADVGLDPA